MIEHYLATASSSAGSIDFLIELIFWVVIVFWFVVTEAVFIGLILRFRKKDGVPAQYITGELKSEKRWITIPHAFVLLCDVVIVFFAVRVWYDVKQNMPEPQQTVRIVAQQWAWSFVQPGPDGRLDTDDDIKTVDELHVQLDTVYHFKLVSRDVLHSFSVPAFRLKQDAIPGRVITGWFKPTKTGAFDIQCVEICGVGHGLMPARIFIETPEQHAAWMAGHSTQSIALASTTPLARE
jgi:cytochrome c oxidase subunit 2